VKAMEVTVAPTANEQAAHGKRALKACIYRNPQVHILRYTPSCLHVYTSTLHNCHTYATMPDELPTSNYLSPSDGAMTDASHSKVRSPCRACHTPCKDCQPADTMVFGNSRHPLSPTTHSARLGMCFEAPWASNVCLPVV
jgi:hypothetical protein